MREMRTIFKRALSLLLAFIMIFGGLTTAFKINVVKAAGEELVQIPGTGKLTLKDNFDLFYKNMDSPDKVTEGTISESKDGSDNVTLILRKNFVGGIVSKEKFNMLRNDFEYIGSITMVNGTNPAVRAIEAAKEVQTAKTESITQEKIDAAQEKINEVADEINKAGLQAQLDEAKTKLAAEKWKANHATILGKTVDTVVEADRAAIDTEIDAHNALPKEVQDLLTAEKKLLVDMLVKLDVDEKLRIAKEETADAANHSTPENIQLAKNQIKELTPEQIAANPDLNNTITAAEKVAAALAKPTAENIAAAQTAIDAVTDETNKTALTNQLKEAQAQSEADKWKADNKDILGKETANVKENDRAAIQKALDEYYALSLEAQRLVPDEKVKLDEMLAKLDTAVARAALIEEVNKENNVKENYKYINAKDNKKNNYDVYLKRAKVLLEQTNPAL